MTIRWSDKEVLVVVGTGGMGLSTARRVGVGRVIMLADINQIGLEAAANALSADGHQVMTQHVDVTSRASVAAAADVGATVRVAFAAAAAGTAAGAPGSQHGHPRPRARPASHAR